MNTNRPISRRQLLKKGTIATAGALALPQLIPSGTLARDGRPGANDRIGIGAIGVGRQGHGLLRKLQRYPEARLIAVADLDIERAQKIGKKFNAEATNDYHRILQRDDVDAIITATTDHWRSAVCIHAAGAGKHIYAEKPLTLTIAEGRKMVQAARAHSIVFQTGSQQRSMPINRLGCELVRTGKLGKIQKVIGYNYPGPWDCALPGQPVPDGLDWDKWCGPVPLVPFHPDLYAPRAKPGWISCRPFSGGEVTGWGSHGIDQIQWALGMDDTGPVEFWPGEGKFNPPTYTKPESRKRGDAICGTPNVSFRYANGVVVELSHGNPGGGIFVGANGKMEIFRGRVTSNPAELISDAIKAASIKPGRGDTHFPNWFECMKTNKRPAADVEIAHRSVTVCHLVNITRWLGRPVKWDPVNETCPGDEEANAYLDRPRRKGYELPEIG